MKKIIAKTNLEVENESMRFPLSKLAEDNNDILGRNEAVKKDGAELAKAKKESAALRKELNEAVKKLRILEEELARKKEENNGVPDIRPQWKKDEH
jgi:hypothetical protein